MCAACAFDYDKMTTIRFVVFFSFVLVRGLAVASIASAAALVT